MSRVIGLDGKLLPLTDVATRARHRLTTLTFSERALVLSIVLVVVAVFCVGLRNEFVDWDDYANLLLNQNYRGLGSAQLAWMFTTTLTGHYIPVTWMSFGLDYLLWGIQPAGYHFTNLVLHAANAVLFYWVSKRLLTAARAAASEHARRAGAAVAALLFAIHPLRAESVAWATERRDVLSGVLFLATLLLYLRAAATEGTRRRWLFAGAVLTFAMSILAKSIVMTLPLLLLVLDWYPLRRLRWPLASSAHRRILSEKIPFVALASAGAAVAYWALKANSHSTPTTTFGLPSRIVMAAYSIVFYISKTILPVDLSPLYELPSHVDPLDSQFLSAGLVVLFISVALVALASRWPAGLAVYAWYVIMLVPVGGLVQHGYQLAHDRYSYLSCLSVAVFAGGGFAWLVDARASGQLGRPLFRVGCAATGTILAMLAVLTSVQVQIWHDTESLWAHATYATPECSICHNNYGIEILKANRSPEAAVTHFQHALALKPENEKPYRGLGMALVQLGRPLEAESALRRVVSSSEADIGPFNNLGVALNQQRRFAEAVPYLRRAVSLDEHNVIARANLGLALVGIGHVEEAITELRRATDEQPFELAPRVALILAYRDAGNMADMHRQLTILNQLHPLAGRNFAAKGKL